MMKPRVYLETTVPSYLTARPSRDVMLLAHQHATREWWAKRSEFDLYISRLVVQECQAGNPQAAAERLAALKGIPLLRQKPETVLLGRSLVRELSLPTKASADAFHIAIAAIHKVDYLLTWNCSHMANAGFRKQIESTCREFGCKPPIISSAHHSNFWERRLMYDDDVLREVREAREAYARQFNFDLAAMSEDLRRQEEEGDWLVVDLSTSRPERPKPDPNSGTPESGPIEAEPSGSHRA